MPDAFFECGDAFLQRLYDTAERKLRENLRSFAGRRVLVEGAGYEKIWLETQPMGGEMAYFRDREAARNNILLFMEHQRADGRLPGSVAHVNGALVPQFDKLQGFCFPRPALDLYYLERDERYLDALEDCLLRFDRWLYAERELTGDGILSSFCVYDTGEDNAVRYGDAPCWWPESAPPEGNAFVPMRSMDITSFSYACRDTLARISRLRGREEEEKERRRLAEETAAALKKHLWNEKRGACFDILPDGSPSPVLCHNTLRCMYWGSLSREMAERFVREHLLVPEEFFTPVPLPSVAANDPAFRNLPENNWSGQVEGLTLQRCVTALENYGLDALVPVIGRRFFAALKAHGIRFTQQYDPFTGAPSSERDGYGPSVLATLELLSRMHGIDAELGLLRFSDIGGVRFRSGLSLGEDRWLMESDGSGFTVLLNGVRVASASAGQALILDREGKTVRKVALDENDRDRQHVTEKIFV